MKKHAFFSALLGTLLLFSCAPANQTAAHEVEVASNDKPLGSFHLENPKEGVHISTLPEFQWEACPNADYYMLEIASTETFNNRLDTEVYYRKDYIQTNSYSISSSLSKKDVTYYWRVTAKNADFEKVCESPETFFLEAEDVGEVVFDLGEPSDWMVHEEGTPCRVSFDNTNFFGNDQESVVVKFDIEDSKQIGWVVVSKTVEKNTYGTDALFLRFYYSGDDAVAFVRVLDNDGEYWRHKILLSNNSKQTCILPYSEFTQVTNKVVVNNRVFDYFHIRYFEVVFEQSFGDGVCLMSEIKAVNTANYTHMFIRKMDFRQFPTEDWAWEGGYNFGYDIDEEGTGYTLRYDTAANEYNEKGIGSFGYGFAKIYAKRFFVGGDLIRMKLKYTGAKNCSISFRIYEEDGDRWAYQQAFSTLVEGEFTEVYVPYEAFSASYLGGNGRREFGFITNLQFGLTNVYGAGTLTYKDVEVIYRKSLPQFQDTTRHVHEDGMLEDFDSYAFPAEPFYKWSSSTENKDEFITLNQLQACGDGNVNAGCFYYKADMAAALYQIKLDVPEEATWNSLSIWLKDASERNSDSRFNYLGDVAAHATIGFYSDLGIQYTYEIPALPKVWTNFVIPFSEFKPNIGKQELLLHDISYFGIAFSYLYYTKDGTHFPTYHQSNPVYLDNISFVEADAFSAELIEKSIKADEDNPNRATLDDCEHYSGNNPMSAWKFDKEHPANSITLSDDVSPSGGNHSIKMAYQGYTSVSYALGLTLDASISDEENGLRPKGLLIDIKGDGKATIHINLYATSGSSTMQVRKTITVFDLEEGWARYQIGFGQFTDYVNPSTASINANNVTNVYKLTIGITNTDDSLSALYVDNIRLSNEFSRSTFKSTIL